MSQSASSRESESVTVTGTGWVQAAPDVLTVDLAVEVHAAGFELLDDSVGDELVGVGSLLVVLRHGSLLSSRSAGAAA